jgi:EmrB/QacA subfamily drug resistance transporter
MTNPRRGPVLAIILVSYFVIVLDISIVITGLPKVQAELGFSSTELSWVQNAYTLAFGGLLLLGARAGDLLGRRRTFIAGVIVFTVASLAVGIAQSATWLIAARAVQGIGAAILAPSTLALLSTSFAAGPERTRAVAWYGAVAGVGASVGLVAGGILADALSWRVGFFINGPIGLALILAAPRFLPESERHGGAFDVLGALSSTLGMTALVFGMVHSATAGWADAVTLGTLGAGVLLIGLFLVDQARARQPIMPLRLFASRERVGAYASRIFFLGAMMGFWFFMTQFLQEVLGFSPFEAGLAFLPMTMANLAVALAVPRLTRRLGNGRLLAGGLLLTLAGMAWLSRLAAGTDYIYGVALPMVLIGAGQGATLSPLTAAGIAGVAHEDAGAASGLVNVTHQLGGSLGFGILVAVFAAAGGAQNLTVGAAAALAIGTVMLTVAFVITVALVVQPGRRRLSPQANRAV